MTDTDVHAGPSDPSVSGFDSSDVMALIRHALTTGAGAIVADGYITGDQAQQVVGAVMALIAVGWSIYNKYGHKKQVASLQAAVRQAAAISEKVTAIQGAQGQKAPS